MLNLKLKIKLMILKNRRLLSLELKLQNWLWIMTSIIKFKIQCQLTIIYKKTFSRIEMNKLNKSRRPFKKTIVTHIISTPFQWLLITKNITLQIISGNSQCHILIFHLQFTIDAFLISISTQTVIHIFRISNAKCAIA